MGGQRERMEKMKPALSMVLLQIFTAGMLLLSKMVLDEGSFVFALLTYRNVVGAVFIMPFAFFSEREKWKRLNWSAFVWIFINALLGLLFNGSNLRSSEAQAINVCLWWSPTLTYAGTLSIITDTASQGMPLAVGLYYYGLRDTTAAYSVNFLNLIPIMTFILAVTVRIERLGFDNQAGRVKIIGTLVCVGGTMVVTAYKGKPLHFWPSHSHMKVHHDLQKGAVQTHQMRGTLLLLGSCFSFAAWYMVQDKLFAVYPYKYWATMFTCLAGSLQTLFIGMILNREKITWRLRWDLQLLAIVYTGALTTAFKFCLVSWVVTKRGPTYPPLFGSLAMIFTTILESFIMGENVTTGSLLGTIMIIGGLYAFLWGKRKELSPKSGGEDKILAHDSTQLQTIIASADTPDKDDAQFSSTLTNSLATK